MSLWKKLEEAKKNFPPIEKKGRNPFFKTAAHPDGSPYIIYDDIVAAVRPKLLEKGLDFRHSSRSTKNHYFVGTYIIDLETGEKTEPFEMPLEYELNPQKQTAGITYAKRATAVAELGLAGEEDNDGNETQKEKQTERQPTKLTAKEGFGLPEYPHDKPIKPNPAKAGEPISEAQAKRLFAICKSSGWTTNELKECLVLGWHIDSTKSILRSDYEEICEMVAKVKPAVAIAKLKESLASVAEKHGADPYYAPPTDRDAPFNLNDVPF